MKHLLLSCVHAEQETEHIIKLMEQEIVSFLLKKQKQTSSIFRLDVLLEYDCLLAGNFRCCCFLMSSAEGWGQQEVTTDTAHSGAAEGSTN